MLSGYWTTNYWPAPAPTAGDSLRQQLVDAVVARMQIILTANGYNTNLGQHVYVWKAGPFLPAEVPGVDIRDIETVKDQTVGEQEHTLVIDLRAVSSGDLSPETMRAIVADVTTAIGADVSWGGLGDADTSPITAEQVEVETADGVKTGVGLRFMISYTTARFNPYS